MKKNKISQYKNSLVGELVKFRVGRHYHYGFVSHVNGDICAIRGLEQKKYSPPQYNYLFTEVKKVDTKTAFRLGRGLIQLFI